MIARRWIADQLREPRGKKELAAEDLERLPYVLIIFSERLDALEDKTFNAEKARQFLQNMPHVRRTRE
jgi:hypothetical protein